MDILYNRRMGQAGKKPRKKNLNDIHESLDRISQQLGEKAKYHEPVPTSRFGKLLYPWREWVNFWISCAAFAIAVIGIPFAFIQIGQANASYRQAIEQFAAEGATYRINIIEGPAMSISPEESTGHLTYVITNTGRTRGTILDIDRDLEDENLTVCVPRMTDNGDLKQPSTGSSWDDIMPINHQFTLEPGQSQLVFITAPASRPKPLIGKDGQVALALGTPLTVTGNLRLHKSDGTSELVPTDTADDTAVTHYTRLKGYEQDVDHCARVANQQE